MAVMVGVAEAKRRFSDLIERVGAGERIVVTRRGRPVLLLVPPSESHDEERTPIGLAGLLGALEDWTDLDQVVEEIYAARRRAKDRDVPDLE